MTSTRLERERLEVSVKHISAIDDTDVTFQSGVTALTGCNATNHTSLLQTLIGALDSDSEERHIGLIVDDVIYTRTLTWCRSP
jgi:ABC-type branched-subunit amino acid transport system ATPase component